jgi:hypothetical protein
MKPVQPLAPFIEGLAMPRFAQIRTGQYPPVERELPSLQASLAEYEKQNRPPPPVIAKPSAKFTEEGFNPFSRTRNLPDPKTQPKPVETTSAAAKEWQPPEYCLLRFLDIGVEPEKTYEYRIQVLMVNPNYEHANVAWPDLAKEKELRSDWIELKDEQGTPLQATIPPDTRFYAIERNNPNLRSYQAPVQFHRWLNIVSPSGSQSGTYAVGEWVVANTGVNRGEYIQASDARTAPRIEVPIWSYAQDNFVLAANTNAPSYERNNIPVSFKPGRRGEYILVDFLDGRATYTRQTGLAGDNPNKVTVSDKGPSELIYLSPEGKLLVRDSETDKQDPERVQRVEHYQKRIEEIKNANKPDPKKQPIGIPAGVPGGFPGGGGIGAP